MTPQPGPAPVRARDLALVAAGGTVGTLARAAVTAVLVPGGQGSWPWGTWAVNVTGSFLLGVLLGHLARRSAPGGAPRSLHLLVGTGVLGGYTTYSTLALDTVTLAVDGAVGRAALYAASTLLVGTAAAAAGLVAGGRRGAGGPRPAAARAAGPVR